MSGIKDAGDNKITVVVNGKNYLVEPGYTIIQVCDMFGIEIPRFCYHDKLKIAGNCRMCLVNVKGSPKPVASCAMPIADNMEVITDSFAVKEMRERVMRFLLANHPLDCPICDQGGECDLQDQAMLYGRDHSELTVGKRAVEPKYFGRLVATHMTRCIHCTRCVRFMSDIAGTHELGMVNRGGDAEIVSTSDSGFMSEMSGNIIDLCPVGALTSKPGASKNRPWEMQHCETIDVMDALGSAIRVDYRGNEVIRIIPRLNEDVNEIWISDKSRFSYDGLSVQRIDRPYIRRNNRLEEASWEEAINLVVNHICNIKNANLGMRAGAILGDMVDCESAMVLRDIMRTIKSPNIDCRQDGSLMTADNPSMYTFNSTIAGIDQADFILLIGVNPRVDAPVLNSRILRRYNSGEMIIANIGDVNDLTYKARELGNSPEILSEIMSGAHAICNVIRSASRPMMILGADLFLRADIEGVLYHTSRIAEDLGFVNESWNGFNVLQKTAARTGCLNLQCVPGVNGMNLNAMLDNSNSLDFLYLLGVDEVDMSRVSAKFVVYQGHHGDNGAHRADVILPGSTYVEKDCSYVNMEGRLQQCIKAVQAPGLARDDWEILCNIACAANLGLPYNTLDGIRQAFLTEVWSQGYDKLPDIKWQPFIKNEALSRSVINTQRVNYYMTDSISRTSRSMVACATDAAKRKIAA